MTPWCIIIYHRKKTQGGCLERVARAGSCRDSSLCGSVGAMNDDLSRPDLLATVHSGRKQAQSRVCTPSLYMYTNDSGPIHGRRTRKLGHASLATAFRPSRLTFQPILRENLESPVVRFQPITTMPFLMCV